MAECTHRICLIKLSYLPCSEVVCEWRVCRGSFSSSGPAKPGWSHSNCLSWSQGIWTRPQPHMTWNLSYSTAVCLSNVEIAWFWSFWRWLSFWCRLPFAPFPLEFCLEERLGLGRLFCLHMLLRFLFLDNFLI